MFELEWELSTSVDSCAQLQQEAQFLRCRVSHLESCLGEARVEGNMVAEQLMFARNFTEVLQSEIEVLVLRETESSTKIETLNRQLIVVTKALDAETQNCAEQARNALVEKMSALESIEERARHDLAKKDAMISELEEEMQCIVRKNEADAAERIDESLRQKRALENLIDALRLELDSERSKLRDAARNYDATNKELREARLTFSDLQAQCLALEISGRAKESDWEAKRARYEADRQSILETTQRTVEQLTQDVSRLSTEVNEARELLKSLQSEESAQRVALVEANGLLAAARKALAESEERLAERDTALELAQREHSVANEKAERCETLTASLTLQLSAAEQQNKAAATAHAAVSTALQQARLDHAQELGAADARVAACCGERDACRSIAAQAISERDETAARVKELEEAMSAMNTTHAAAISLCKENSFREGSVLVDRITLLECRVADLQVLSEALHAEGEHVTSRFAAAAELNEILARGKREAEQKLEKMEIQMQSSSASQEAAALAQIEAVRREAESQCRDAVARAAEASVRLSTWIQALLDRLSQLSSARAASVRDCELARSALQDSVQVHVRTVEQLQQHLGTSESLKLTLLDSSVHTTSTDQRGASLAAELSRDHEAALRTAVSRAVDATLRECEEHQAASRRLKDENDVLQLRTAGLEAELSHFLSRLEICTGEAQAAQARAVRDQSALAWTTTAHSAELAAWAAKFESLSEAWDDYLHRDAVNSDQAQVALDTSRRTLDAMTADHLSAARAAATTIAAQVSREQDKWREAAIAAEKDALFWKGRVACLEGETVATRQQLSDLAERYEHCCMSLDAAEASLAAAEATHRSQLAEALAKLAAAVAERDAWRAQAAMRAEECARLAAECTDRLREANQQHYEAELCLRREVSEQAQELRHIRKRTSVLAEEVRLAKSLECINLRQ